MAMDSFDALSPLDGRYAGKLAAVRNLFSEAGLMRERVRVECAWFLALAAGPAAAALAQLPRTGPGPALGAVQRSGCHGCRGHQANRGTHQSRRESGGNLAAWRAAGTRRGRRRTRMAAFRMHLGRHQQSCLRPHAEERSDGPAAAHAGWHRRRARHARPPPRRGAHAGAHPRAERHAHHSRQGDGECRRAAANAARRPCARRHPRQDERRRRQLQCACRSSAAGGLAPR